MGVMTRSQAAASPNGAVTTAAHSRKLPVTLLSGFLGAGKTTLLRHVLSNKVDLRCAILVNDMAEINIDAGLIKNGSLVQAEEKLVEMQNGCICCTLREDLIQEVTKLAEQQRFDYLLIESTGISEPMQVAETFDMPVEGKALKDVARLDTCVTVIDASNLHLNLNSVQKVKEQPDAKGGEEGDERNLADLLVDQIEFADVIVLNKTDLVSRAQLAELQALLRALNPGAQVLPTTEAKVELSSILDTGRFDLEKAQRSAGWLQSLLTEGPVVPETEEYGISSFVYRARRPFHPQRLWDFLEAHFLLEQPELQYEDDDDDDAGMQQQEGGGDEAMADAASEASAAEQPPADPLEVAAKQQAFRGKFGAVLRSKGFVWLAGRDSVGGEWSQAGAVLRLTPGAPWFAALPREAWPDVEEQEVMKDFAEGVGDRRQELVFIGQAIKRPALVAALEACLCSDAEAVQAAALPDPFTKWPSFEIEYVTDSDAEEGESDAEAEADDA